MPVLRVTAPGRQPWSHRFEERLIVGRDPSTDLRLDDPSVSAFHAVLAVEDDGLLAVTDLRSSNGSYIDRERIHRAALVPGSVLTLGSCKLELDPTASAREHSASSRGLGATIDDEDTAPWGHRPNPLDRDRLEQAWGELATLYELSHVLEVGQQESEVHQAVADLVARSTGAQRVCLVDYDPVHMRAHTLYAWPDGADFSGGRPFSRSIIDQVIVKGRTILVPDVSLVADLRNAPSIAVNAIRSALCAPLIGNRGVIGMILATHHEAGFEFQEHQIRLMTAIGQAVGMALENHRLYWRQERSFVGTLEALVQALDARDPYTAGHSLRVTELSLSLARWYPLEEDLIRPLRLGALLHDVGKIGVEDACLRAARKLTDDEFAKIRRHPALGHRILEPLDELEEVRAIVRHHHERWDGTGYPDGLKGETIPLPSRIIAVADTIDAITSDRPYRRGSPLDLALGEVRRYSGEQFDPGVVKALDRALAAGELAALSRNGV
jgi:putative nucleotidyltransferase with HDIG domain